MNGYKWVFLAIGQEMGENGYSLCTNAQAAQHLKDALEVHPDDATVSFYEGEALENAPDLVGARNALETSLKLLPGQFRARLLLGQVYLGLKDTTGAEDQFEAALLLQPGSVDAEIGLADAQIAKGNFAEPAQSLEALSKIHGTSALVFDRLAKAYAGLGKRAEAQRAEARAKLLYTTK
ncbi:MAG TPA: tetratricopeptide repeat protein [Chthoniobacterales bacterium]|nr:tetratricopeptide repeat protein [Chthoniobacterales bacterium]